MTEAGTAKQLEPGHSMPHALDRRSAPVRYGFALLAVAIALLVTLASRHFGLANRSAAFLAAILLTGWYAGTGPMILAMVLSTFAFDFFFLPPLYTLGLHRGPDPYLVWFLLFACLAAWFSAARRRSARLLEQARSELEDRVAARTAELQRSEAYLVAAQELSHTGSWSRRISTGEGSWSVETYRIFGLDPRGPAPNRQQILELCHPDDRALFDQALEATVREKRGFEIDFRIIRPDGSIRYVHSKGQPVLDDTGAVDEVMGAIMDVTDRKRAERALRRVRERALEARFAAMLSERTRLAREIHDTLLQGFTGIGLKLLAVANRVTGQPEVAAALREVLGLTQKTLVDARRAVWDLRSPTLAAGDFSAALRTAAEDCLRGTPLELEYDVAGPTRLVAPEVEAVVVRVTQEALTNVIKHAHARTVRVRLSFEARAVRLSVIDDGRGFAVEPDFQAYGGHWGLLGMRERASQIHGKLSLQSTPGRGTEVVLLVPYGVGQESPAPEPSFSSAS
jgi:PAS domain S-box-containing protein